MRVATPVSLLLLTLPGTAAKAVDIYCRGRPTDAALLNGAIASSQRGDNLRIHGLCLVDATIVLLGDRSYTGDTRSGTVIMQVNNTNLPAILASDTWANNEPFPGEPVRLEHFTVDGNRAANTGSSGIVLRCREPLVQDVHVQNVPSDGIVVTDVARDGSTR